VATVIFVGSIAMLPLLGTEFVPKSDFSETSLTLNTPVGSSPVVYCYMDDLAAWQAR
jgi:hydrophobic/amphiphilic exporter-1 (mainly G- bacteria), HAE1 family